MDPVIHSLLEAAKEAPSGENAQPWRFRVDGRKIFLFHNPSSDRSLYNFNGYGTLAAEGAAIENMLIAGRALGYRTDVELFPESSDKNLIATVTVSGELEASDADQEFFKIIPKRTTNRKAYEKRPLPQKVSTDLESIAQSEGVTYQRITDREKIEELALVASVNERVMLGNKELHEFFFSHLTWTAKEDKEKKVGFYIKTLELPPPAQFLFRIFKFWPVMKVLRALGFPKVVGKQNAATYASSAEFGIIAVPSIGRESMVQAGRAFERIWLTATKHGVNLQPLTGTIFMNLFATNDTEGHFSDSERALLKGRVQTLYDLTGIDNETIVLMFRLGYGPSASARATRYSVEELII